MALIVGVVAPGASRTTSPNGGTGGTAAEMMVSPERQWHKRANVVAYLPKSLQEPWRRTPQAALGR